MIRFYVNDTVGDYLHAKEKSSVPLVVALIPVIAVGLFLGMGTFVYEAEPHFPILLGAVVAGLVALQQGFSWKTIESGLMDSIARAMPALLILLIIGMIIGTWVASGIVPALTYFGFQILPRAWFLPAVFILCSVMSLVTGSSWTTAGTVGIAAIGVGQGLGLPPAAVAGAVVSGAFFGDKISPLSDSTNLTASVVGVELYTHIKHMLITTLPAFFLSLIMYAVYGYFWVGEASSPGEALRLQQVLVENFNLSPFLLIPPAVVIVLILFKVPAIPSLVAGTIAGAMMQIFVQGQGMGDVLQVIYHGFSIETGWEQADQLLSRGGMASMYSTVSLGLIALSFGGIMERCGMLSSLVGGITRLVRTTGNLVSTTVFTAFLINIFGANQYLAVIIPGQMFAGSYERLGLQGKNLSRNLEAGGTLTAPLIPWNSSGVFMLTVLSVNPLAYAPYAFICWLTPIIAMLYGYTDFSMEKVLVNMDDFPAEESGVAVQARNM